STDGVFVMSGSWDGIARVWDQIATLDSLDGHTNFVNAITLSRNDRLLASISEDKTARLWNLDTNLQVGPPLQHDHWVQCAALSADGQVLVTGGYEQNIYAWDIRAILNKTGLEDLLLPIAHVNLIMRDMSINVFNNFTNVVPPDRRNTTSIYSCPSNTPEVFR
ncbi:hypothetical protein CY34DRAFT_85575, partial [Suillus luteus UH-Slu-Lm8-n1]